MMHPVDPSKGVTPQEGAQPKEPPKRGKLGGYTFEAFKRDLKRDWNILVDDVQKIFSKAAATTTRRESPLNDLYQKLLPTPTEQLELPEQGSLLEFEELQVDTVTAAERNRERADTRERAAAKAEKEDPARGEFSPVGMKNKWVESLITVLKQPNCKLRLIQRTDETLFRAVPTKDLKGGSKDSRETAKKLLGELKVALDTVFRDQTGIKRGSLDHQRYDNFQEVISLLENHTWFKNVLSKNTPLAEEFETLKAQLKNTFWLK